MSRHRSAPAYGHSVRRYSFGYRMQWTVDFYYAGSRMRYPRTFTRDTDAAGAKRFAKKHGLADPTITQ